MFDKFADLVVRRYKHILVIWIIVLIFAVPLSQKVRDVVVYEETGGVPDDMESKIAAKLIEEKFPTSMSNSSVIIVIEGDNVTDEQTRDYLLAIDDNLETRLKYVDSFFSVYTAYQVALNYTIRTLYPQLLDTEKNFTLFSQLIYASPYSYIEAYNLTYPNVKSVSYNIYMVPSLYLNSFLQLGDEVPIDTRNALASNATWTAIECTIDTSNEMQVYLMSNYLNMFNMSWTSSFNETSPSYLPNDTLPQERAQNITNIVAPKVFSFENPTTTETLVMSQVFNSLNISNWNDERTLMSIASNMANETSWNAISSMLSAMGIEYLTMLSGYHTQFHRCFLTTISDLSYDINLTPSQRAKICIDKVAPAFFGFDVSKSVQDNIFAQITYLSWASYSIYTFGNETISRSLCINFISQISSLSQTFLNDIYNLILTSNIHSFENRVSALIDEIIRNGTIDTYPVQIPSQYLSKLVSKDRVTTIVNIGFSKPADDTEIQKNVARLRTLLSELKKESGANVKTYVTGGAALNADQEEESKKDNLLVEPITVILIIVLISIFFISFVTPIIPLFNAGIAFVIAQAVIFIVGSLIADIHYSVLTLMFTMILAAGSDYSIFIIARYREERVEGKNREDAVRTALTWAGESIATSGATVMIGLGALSLMSFKMVRTLGLCLAMGVGVALLVSLTLLPSCILLLGNRIFWPSNKKWKADSDFAKERREKLQAHKGYFSRSAQFSIKNAKVITATCIILTLPALYGILSLETSYDFIGTMPDTESKKGIERLSEGFGAGNIMPTYIVVTIPESIMNDNGSYETKYIYALEEICIAIESVDNVERVLGPSRPLGFPINFSDAKEVMQYSSDIKKCIGNDNKTILLTVILVDEPFTRRSMDTMPALRDKIRDAKNDIEYLKDAKFYLGGSTASMKDIEDLTFRDFRQVAIIVAIGIFLVLLSVLRSVMIPLRLIFTIMLSITWTLALTMLVFQTIINMPVIWLMPLVLFVILMGLGMDYDIFLCTRIREEVLKGKSDEEAIMTAVERTGGIITICGAIMAGAFGSMMLSHMGLTQEFGFGLGVAILLDATVVRIYLVPAIMVLLKRWNWWMPFGLQRVEREELREKKEVEK